MSFYIGLYLVIKVSFDILVRKNIVVISGIVLSLELGVDDQQPVGELVEGRDPGARGQRVVAPVSSGQGMTVP